MLMAFLEDPTFWAGVGLAIFILILIYFGVPGQITKALDARRFAIRDELEDARRLREEAQNLLATNQRRQRDAVDESKEILNAARNEAERMVAEARSDLADLIDRRRRGAQDRIARAEAQAVSDIRAYAASVSVMAAREVIRTQMTPEQDRKIVGAAIQNLGGQLRRS